jgi:HemY protein
VVSEHWAPISPVTRALDAFRWRVPVEAIDEPAGVLRADKVEALVGLGAPTEPAIGHDQARAVIPPAAQAIEAADRQPPPARARPVLPASAPVPARAAESVTAVPKTLEAVPVTSTAAREARPAEAPADRSEARTERARPKPEAPAQSPKTADAARARARKPAETKIFVPPRAPDDPGPESTEADGGLEIGPLRPSGAKA